MRKTVLIAVLVLLAMIPVAYAAMYVFTLNMSKEVIKFNTLATEICKAEPHNYFTGIKFKVVDENTKYIILHFTVKPEGMELEENATLEVQVRFITSGIEVGRGTATFENGVWKVKVVSTIKPEPIMVSTKYEYGIYITVKGIKKLGNNARLILSLDKVESYTHIG